MQYHEIANIFPLIQGDEFKELCEDIRRNGVREPIVLYEGKILDGRNRYRACKEIGLTAPAINFEGEDPLGYVISLNVHRRHLRSDQRAAAAIEAEGIDQRLKKEAQERIISAGEHGKEGGRGKTPSQKIDRGFQYNENRANSKLAETFGTNRQYINDIRKVKEEQPETFEAIKRGEVKLAHVKRDKKREERLEKLLEVSKGNAELPQDKTYPVIYADPPWRYEHSQSDSRQIENQYPTMTLDDICALSIPATDDAILFMWGTSPKLEEAFRVIREWGFTYRTCAVWDKQKIGMGYYFRQQHELLLIATKGNLPAPLPENRPGSVFSYPRGEHSAKPHEVAEIIEKMYPELPKLEMFCRSAREGWGVWGNQSA
mgnify:CR=1 FL=1